MDQPISIMPDPALASSGDGLLTDVIAALALDDPIATRAALLAVRERGADLATARMVLGELVARALVWLDTEALVIPALDTLAALDESAALVAFDLVFAALFPEGKVDADGITNAAVALLTRLLGAAGHVEDARGFLISSRGKRDPARFLPLVHATWCHLRGVDSAIAPLWPALPAAADAGGPLEEAATWRAIARERAEAREWTGALDALTTAMVLPVPDRAKVGVGADFAVLALWLLARGQDVQFKGVQRIELALAAAPGLAREAMTHLASWPDDDLHGIYDPGLREMVRDWLHGFVTAPPPAYPLRAGKPHVDIVWLEVTNFCNQKCTFCPDMHREDQRQWLPLDKIKAVIDQLVDHVSVGSMQLNAYGEPLLHPQIDEILSYIRERNLPWPTFFTTHGLTLAGKKLRALSHNYPQGIAVSLHNDSQESYALSRSAKIGDYDTLVSRVTDLLTQMVAESAACHVRLYQMVANHRADPLVPPEVRAAFPETPERMARHVRKWEAIAAHIAQTAPDVRRVRALTNSFADIEHAFVSATHGESPNLPVLAWLDQHGVEQVAFMSPRPVGTYANLLLEYDPRWQVQRRTVNAARCGFVPNPSLAIFATGRLGLCCLDLNSTATFASLDDFPDIGAALRSDQARKIFAELAHGIATSRGCQICLATGAQLCGTAEVTPILSHRATV